MVILMLSLVVVIFDNGVIKLISCTLCMLAFTYFLVLIFNAKGRKTRKEEIALSEIQEENDDDVMSYTN